MDYRYHGGYFHSMWIQTEHLVGKWRSQELNPKAIPSYLLKTVGIIKALWANTFSFLACYE
jgi:hypothetical protein